MEIKEGYKTLEEILEEVAKEEGLKFDQVDDLWRHQKYFIEKKMDEPDVYSIFLPYLGTLSLNVSQYTTEIKGKTRATHQTIIDKIGKLTKLKSYVSKRNAHKRVPGAIRLVRRIIANFDVGHTDKKKPIKQEEAWEMIEKYSNGKYDKRETKLT